MLQTLILALAIPLLLAALTPFVSRLARKGVQRQDKLDAYARLVRDPRLYVGARLAGIYVAERPAPLVPACELVHLELERVVVRITDPEHPDCGCEHSFALQAFERLYPRLSA